MLRKPAARAQKGASPSSPTQIITAIIGGILLCIGAIWGGSMLLHSFGGPAISLFPVYNGGAGTTGNDMQFPPLTAAGISLSHTDQAPPLNRQQALLLASQLEPDAAANAKNIGNEFVLMSYTNSATPAAHANFNNTPIWLIVYQKIPLGSTDASTKSSYDLYVFLDASTGKELLLVRA
ncbi:MAG: hypothetical protein M3Z24_03495 [Chloroflexota bacterium]|nr:hypothetical protein [Chloroflexota bacterium]